MRKELRALFVMALLAAPYMGLPYSATAQPQENKKQCSEMKYGEKLTKEVLHQLVMLPWYSVFDNLAYKVEGDKVTLYGQVTRPTLKSDAEAAVKSIEGVSSVANNIEVLPLSPMDDEIRRAVYRAIYGDPGLSRYSAPLQLPRNAPRCFLERLDDPRHIGLVRLRQRTAGAKRRRHVPHGVEDGRAKAPRTQTIFFVIHGVARLLHVLQVSNEFRNRRNGFRRPLFQSLLLHHGFDFMFRQPGQQTFPHARGMQKHAAADPGVDLEESGGFDFFDVHRFALVQHCQVHGHSNLFTKCPHEWQGKIGDVQVGLRVSAEAQDFEAKAVAPRFCFAPQVAASFEGAQNVAGGTFGDGQFAADFGICHAVAALSRSLENIQRALDRHCGTGL